MEDTRRYRRFPLQFVPRYLYGEAALLAAVEDVLKHLHLEGYAQHDLEWQLLVAGAAVAEGAELIGRVV